MNQFEIENFKTSEMSGVESNPAQKKWEGEITIQPQARQSDTSYGLARPLSQLEKAIDEFEGSDPAANAHDPVIEHLMGNAQILRRAGEHRLALNILRNVLMRAPEHLEGLLGMGLSLREEKRYEEALKCFRALAKAGHRSQAQLHIAETLYLCERDEMALSSYREVLKHVVNDKEQLFEIYKNIGNIHVRAGDYESAEEFYNKAYVLKPNSDVLMVNYGTLEIQRESLAEAVARFRRSVEINPNNDKGWVGLSLVHRQMGDFELAWANVQRALDINAANRTALRLVIDWGVADSCFSIAITRLQEYLEEQGEDAEMCFTLAKIFTHVGRLHEARTEMERVLALDPAIEGGEALKSALKSALDRELSANGDQRQDQRQRMERE